jgi:hypothetical protein
VPSSVKAGCFTPACPGAWPGGRGRSTASPFRLRVTGTAGSGKTQLALNVLSDAIAAGRRPLYVCYNRPLADHIARIAPAGCRVATYHQLCDRLYRASGQTPDFSRPGAFQALETFMAHYQPDSEAVCDELIVDEGQDFQPDWKDNLLRLLKPDGRAWWLEDPMQNLYGRAPLDLPGWVGLHAEVNYRSPKDILERLNRLLGPDSAIRAGSPISGGAVDILTYHDAAGLMERTKTAITRGLGAGFRKEAIALITYRGREHSRFTPLDRLGPHSLKAYHRNIRSARRAGLHRRRPVHRLGLPLQGTIGAVRHLHRDRLCRTRRAAYCASCSSA